MLDLSKEVTIFVITTDKSCNYDECIKALKAQNVFFNIIIIKNYHPMSNAFQQMINKCETAYYIQVDEDMILYPNAIETMYNEIIKTPNNISIVAFMLKDIHLNFPICGVKIYKHSTLKKYPYNLTCLSCEVEQIDRMKIDGYTFYTSTQIVGDHSPDWTNVSIFERYFNIMEKYKKFKYDWMKDIPNKLWEILKDNTTKQNLFALLGAYTSIIKSDTEQSEKDYTQEERPELVKLKSLI